MSNYFTDPKTLSHEALEEGDRLAPRFDAAGLITVVTQEASTGEVLMLAHMNAEALELSIGTGVAHYWSRSRGKIWKKGESSGELQRIIEIRVDCDQDAILMRVEQTGRGAACHTGRKSCFYRRIDTVSEQPGLVDIGMKRLFDPAEVYGAKG
jgi:phosphoribosyl-AMP cyclohydrolase